MTAITPQGTRLTATSYVVLGLIDQLGVATPYELKRTVALSVGNFWSLPHSQLYAEPDRLQAAGYLTVEREETGRRRKRFALTEAGRGALAAWLAEPSNESYELRDPGLLKIFLGADPASLAHSRLPVHRAKLAEYEQLHADAPDGTPPGVIAALEAGIDHERAFCSFWERFAKE